MVQILPSILEKDFASVQKRVEQVQSFASLVHIDIMDGQFVPQKTFSEPAAYGMLPVKLSVHLMIAHPEFSLRRWLSLENVEHIFVHEETVANFSEIVEQVHARGKKIGLAFNPETSLPPLVEKIRLSDMVMIMGIVPGASGQQILPDTFEKVCEAKKLFPNLPIVVDGGVSLQNKKRLVNSGAQMLVSYSALFDSTDPEAAYKELSA